MKHETFDTYIIFFPSPETLVYEISKNDFCNLFGQERITFYISQEIFHASCWFCYGQYWPPFSFFIIKKVGLTNVESKTTFYKSHVCVIFVLFK